jgi:hypothetical protein
MVAAAPCEGQSGIAQNTVKWGLEEMKTQISRVRAEALVKAPFESRYYYPQNTGSDLKRPPDVHRFVGEKWLARKFDLIEPAEVYPNSEAWGTNGFTFSDKGSSFRKTSRTRVKLRDQRANELATRLAISPEAVEEGIRRELLSFVNHRGCLSWRFGDSRNGSLRRLDGEPFCIKGEFAKAEAETRGESWHRLIGLDDVATKDRSDVLLVIEGSKDALAALHFADAEGRLSRLGVVAALGAGVHLCAEDVEKLSGRRLRIFGDADAAGQEAVSRVAKQLLAVAKEVQTFDIAGLNREDGASVKDLFDISRIDYDDFEANRDLWSITDLDSKGARVQSITDTDSFFSSPLPLPHVFPESHGFPVYPVSNSQDLGKELETLAKRNACTVRDTARIRRWKLVCDLAAVAKKIGRELRTDELLKTFDEWHSASKPHLDPNKTHGDYLAKFLAELGKVRVPTGEGETLNKALEHVSALSVFELLVLPEMVEPPESWRRLAALHRELARQSANGTYFLTCRHAAKAHPSLNKDSALTVNRALERLGVIKCERVGDPRPGGKASEFRYVLPLKDFPAS